MPWFEDDAYPSGWRWERADAEPVTEMLPIIPPPAVDSPRLRIPGYTPPEPDLASTAEWAVLPAEAPTVAPVTSSYDTSNVEEPMSGPIEVKVSAATIATAASGAAVWALQTYVFRGEVPLPVSAAVQVAVPAIVAFIAGYLARHTPRPDLHAAPVDEPGVHALDGQGRDGADEKPASLFERDDRP